MAMSNLAHRWMAVRHHEKNAKLCKKGSYGCHVTHFWNFGTPLIYRERLMLECSYLAWRWMVVSTDEKTQNQVRRVMWGHVTHFCRVVSTNEKCKSRSIGVMWGSRDPLLEFWDPWYMWYNWSQKFQIWHRDGWRWALTKNKLKIGSKKVFWGSSDPLLECWDPPISPRRMKLETWHSDIWQWVLTQKIQI